MSEAMSKTDTGWMPQLGYGMIKGRHATSEQYIKYIEAELAELRHGRETWRDWQKLVDAERANTAEAVKQRDEAQAELATAIAVRDDNEAVAVERLARLALVEADADALANLVECGFAIPCVRLKEIREAVGLTHDYCAGCVALAAHEALKSK